jgi:hypothetical protein
MEFPDFEWSVIDDLNALVKLEIQAHKEAMDDLENGQTQSDWQAEAGLGDM